MSDPATTEALKIFGVDWANALMTLCTAIGTVVVLFPFYKKWRDSKIKSFWEEAAPAKLAILNVLADRFLAVDGFISAMKGERKIVQDDLHRALSAIGFLSSTFPQEKELVSALSELKAPAYEKPEGCKTSRLENCKTYKKDYPLEIRTWSPQNLSELENAINQAKAKHLNIG